MARRVALIGGASAEGDQPPMRRGAVFVSLALAVTLGPAARAAPPSAAQRAAEQAIKDLGLQSTLPHFEPAPIATDGGWNFQLPEWSLWVMAALGIALLLYLFKDYIPILRGRGAGDWGEAGDPAAPRQARAAGRYQLAEALARDGRFVEAMHELLLEALGEIRARLGDRLADSLTSREILRKAPLTEPGQAALREIIGRVEWTYFGEHPGQRNDYLVCRDSFERLRATLKDMPAP
jgi:hypothetical protein